MHLSAAYQHQNEFVKSLSLAQRERLAFIDFNLQFFGKISRSDLINRFRTGLAASTRDFAAYREIAQANLKLDHSTKQYLRTGHFEPIFQFSAEAILQSVSKGFSDGITASIQPSAQCFEAVQLIHPNIHIIAALMRSIHNQVACQVKYVSISSGESTRIIVPHAIINNGHRWHVRAFDEKSNAFRDFVCTRFTQVSATNTPALNEQHASCDDQFNRLVTLVLMVHPGIDKAQAIEMDYAMQGGEKIMQVRAALAAYILRHWQVDCSFEHRILNQGCQLALKNHEVLDSIENPQLAPGFTPKK
ncbi:MAG: hypothetical protein ACJAVV_001099 [Alphaproteobacteria bacterium]|jgi:hypothetical protein